MNMKKIFGLATAGIMAATMALCTACGVDQEKVKGDWSVDTIAGKPVAEYTAELGGAEFGSQLNFHIEEDKATVETPSATGETETKELKPTWRSNGVELKDGDTLVYALELDTDKNVLKYKADYTGIGGGKEEEVVLKKGTYDFAAALSELQGGAAAAPAEGEEAAPAEGDAAAVEGEVPAEGEEELVEEEAE